MKVQPSRRVPSTRSAEFSRVFCSRRSITGPFDCRCCSMCSPSRRTNVPPPFHDACVAVLRAMARARRHRTPGWRPVDSRPRTEVADCAAADLRARSPCGPISPRDRWPGPRRPQGADIGALHLASRVEKESLPRAPCVRIPSQGAPRTRAAARLARGTVPPRALQPGRAEGNPPAVRGIGEPGTWSASSPSPAIPAGHRPAAHGVERAPRDATSPAPPRSVAGSRRSSALDVALVP
jgi:hypothetical protein